MQSKIDCYINHIKTRGSKGLKKFRKGTALLVLAIFVVEMFLSSMTAYAFGMPKSSNAVTEASVTDNRSVEIVNKELYPKIDIEVVYKMVKTDI